jgi:hypothetical protein
MAASLQFNFAVQSEISETLHKLIYLITLMGLWVNQINQWFTDMAVVKTG